MKIGKREIAPDAKMPLISLRLEQLDDIREVKPRVKEWLDLGGRGIEVDGKKPAVKKHVAAAIKEFKGNVDRKDLFLTATVPNCNHKVVTEKVKDDLQVLNTEYVDLILIDHLGGGNCSLAWAELEKIYTSKQARAIGVKNPKKKQLVDIVANAEVIPHVCQLGLNVFENSPQITNFVAENKIEIQSNFPFGAANETDLTITSENEIIQNIAKAHDVSAYQIAMKWILHHGWSLSFDAPLDVLKMKNYPDMNSFKLTHPEMVALNKLSKRDGKPHNGQHHNDAKLEIDTRAIAAGVQMPVISLDFDKFPNEKIAEKKMNHWISIGGTGFYVSNNIRMFGRILQDKGGENNIDRENIFLTMKVHNCNHTDVANKVKTELQFLGTDYADLLLLHHSKEGNCNLAWKKMKKAFDANQTRAIGISHFPIIPLKNLLNKTKIKPHAYQGTFNIFNPQFNILRFLQKEEIKVISDSPFGDDHTLISENPSIEKIAAERGVTSFQVAMKWVLQHKMLLSFAANKNEGAQKGVDMSAFTLTNQEMRELNKLWGNNRSSNKKHCSGSACVGTVVGISTILLVFLLAGAGIIIARKNIYRRRKKRSMEEATDGIFMASRRSSVAEEGVRKVRDGAYRDEPAAIIAGDPNNDEKKASPKDEMVEIEMLSGDIC